jgi:hypothetical protein
LRARVRVAVVFLVVAAVGVVVIVDPFLELWGKEDYFK